MACSYVGTFYDSQMYIYIVLIHQLVCAQAFSSNHLPLKLKAAILNMAAIPSCDQLFLLSHDSSDIDIAMALDHWQVPETADPKDGFISCSGKLLFNYTLTTQSRNGLIEVLLLRHAFVVRSGPGLDHSVWFCFW